MVRYLTTVPPVEGVCFDPASNLEVLKQVAQR